MKKFFALLLALVMVLSLVACGDKKTDDNQDNNTDDQQGGTTTSTNPDDIDDNMTSEDGKYEIAFVTRRPAVADGSFNQGTFDGVKLYAANNGLSYKYYQPANGNQATDDDRYDAMKAAVDGGAKVVVCAGFMQGAALARAAAEFTDTSFVFIDGDPVADENGNDLNIAGSTFCADSAATSPVTLSSRKAMRSSASPAAAAARTPPASVTAGALLRARTMLLGKWIRPST